MHLLVRRMKNAAILGAILIALIAQTAWGTTISNFNNVPATKDLFVILGEIVPLFEKRGLTGGLDEIKGIRPKFIIPAHNPRSVDSASTNIFGIDMPESLLYQFHDDFFLSSQLQDIIADLNDTFSLSDNSRKNKFNITKVVGEFTVDTPRHADTIVLVPEPGAAFFILTALTALRIRSKGR